METFLTGYFKVNPTFAVYQGRHEFDRQLPDWSHEGIKAGIEYRKKAIADAISEPTLSPDTLLLATIPSAFSTLVIASRPNLRAMLGSSKNSILPSG